MLFELMLLYCTNCCAYSSVIDDSSTCPICFALREPPHLAPIILTPCGHAKCAKCLTVHTANQRKKARLEVGGPISAPPCPQCKARMVAQSVNITLQNIVTERLAFEEYMRRAEMESTYPKTPVRESSGEGQVRGACEHIARTIALSFLARCVAGVET